MSLDQTSRHWIGFTCLDRALFYRTMYTYAWNELANLQHFYAPWHVYIFRSPLRPNGWYIGHSNYCYILGKQNVDYMQAGKRNISKRWRVTAILLPLLIIYMTRTGLKDHFDILAPGQSDIHCKIKETLLIPDLKPALNENVGRLNKVCLFSLTFSLSLLSLFGISGT